MVDNKESHKTTHSLKQDFQTILGKNESTSRWVILQVCVLLMSHSPEAVKHYFKDYDSRIALNIVICGGITYTGIILPKLTIILLMNKHSGE